MNYTKIITSVSLGMTLLLLGITGTASGQTINSTLGLGSKGAEVTKLQNFLASNSLIYPRGLVTGYYGPLTEEAVTQFQVNYDLPQVGNFGPMTQARANRVISSGLGLDVSAPIIYAISVTASDDTATINWSTDVLSKGRIYFDTKPFFTSIPTNESETRFTAPIISGSIFRDDSVMRTAQSITLKNLSADTTYYYMIQTTDASGNAAVTWPNTFRTSK